MSLEDLTGNYTKIAGGEDDFIWNVNQEKMQLKTSAALLADPFDYVLDLFSAMYNSSPQQINVKVKTSHIELLADGDSLNKSDIDKLMAVFFSGPENNDLFDKYGQIASAIYSSFHCGVQKVTLESGKDGKKVKYTVEKVEDSKKLNKKEQLSVMRFGESALSFKYEDKGSVDSGLKITAFRKAKMRDKVADIFTKKSILKEYEKIASRCNKSFIPVKLNGHQINDKKLTEKIDSLKYSARIKEDDIQALLYIDAEKKDHESVYFTKSGVTYPSDNDLMSGYSTIALSGIIESRRFNLNMGKNRSIKNTHLAEGLVEKIMPQIYTQLINAFLTERKNIRYDVYTIANFKTILQKISLIELSGEDMTAKMRGDTQVMPEFKSELLKLPLLELASRNITSIESLVKVSWDKREVLHGLYYSTDDVHVFKHTDFLKSLVENKLDIYGFELKDYDKVLSERALENKRKFEESQIEQKKDFAQKKRSSIEDFLSKFMNSENAQKVSRIFEKAYMHTGSTAGVVAIGAVCAPFILTAGVVVGTMYGAGYVAYHSAKGTKYAAKATKSGISKSIKFIGHKTSDVSHSVGHVVSSAYNGYLGEHVNTAGKYVKKASSATGNVLSIGASKTLNAAGVAKDYVSGAVMGTIYMVGGGVSKGFSKLGGLVSIIRDHTSKEKENNNMNETDASLDNNLSDETLENAESKKVSVTKKEKTPRLTISQRIKLSRERKLMEQTKMNNELVSLSEKIYGAYIQGKDVLNIIPELDVSEIYVRTFNTRREDSISFGVTRGNIILDNTNSAQFYSQKQFSVVKKDKLGRTRDPFQLNTPPLVIDMRKNSAQSLARYCQTTDGMQMVAPFLIDHIHSGKKIRYSSMQSTLELRWKSTQDQYKQENAGYHNATPYSEDILDYYRGIFKNIKDHRIITATELYKKSDPEFHKAFDLLDRKEVKTFVGKLFEEQLSNSQLDTYIESKYPDIVSEAGRNI